MPTGLNRYYGTGDLHFITCSCHQRKPWLDTTQRRDLFLNILEEVRKEHRFVVLGYVVMPEHFHLLMSDPQVGDPSTVMQSVKQRVCPEGGSTHQALHRKSQITTRKLNPDLATAFLRLQCVDGGKADREVTLHASKSSESRIS